MDICTTLEMGLKLNGFYVASFTDPLTALAKFENGLFDLALLDVRMPKISGFELYMKLRDQDPRMKVCFLTAFEAFEEFGRLFPGMAAKHFMQKPVGITELVTRVKTILND
jgi:DNA-binding response OmpR family regulator